MCINELHKNICSNILIIREILINFIFNRFGWYNQKKILQEKDQLIILTFITKITHFGSW